MSISYVCPFQVLNLFLALLLSSFGASNLSAASGSDDETNKLSEAINRIARLIRWTKRMVVKGIVLIKNCFVFLFSKALTAIRGESTTRLN